MLKKEEIFKNLQTKWNENNDSYSEDSFKEYIESYCRENFEDGYFVNENGRIEYIVDWVLHNIDLAR